MAEQPEPPRPPSPLNTWGLSLYKLIKPIDENELEDSERPVFISRFQQNPNNNKIGSVFGVKNNSNSTIYVDNIQNHKAIVPPILPKRLLKTHFEIVESKTSETRGTARGKKRKGKKTIHRKHQHKSRKHQHKSRKHQHKSRKHHRKPPKY